MLIAICWNWSCWVVTRSHVNANRTCRRRPFPPVILWLDTVYGRLTYIFRPNGMVLGPLQLQLYSRHVRLWCAALLPAASLPLATAHAGQEFSHSPKGLILKLQRSALFPSQHVTDKTFSGDNHPVVSLHNIGPRLWPFVCLYLHNTKITIFLNHIVFSSSYNFWDQCQ